MKQWILWGTHFQTSHIYRWCGIQIREGICCLNLWDIPILWDFRFAGVTASQTRRLLRFSRPNGVAFLCDLASLGMDVSKPVLDHCSDCSGSLGDQQKLAFHQLNTGTLPTSMGWVCPAMVGGPVAIHCQHPPDSWAPAETLVGIGSFHDLAHLEENFMTLGTMEMCWICQCLVLKMICPPKMDVFPFRDSA
jgi:hypothetical protein